MTNLVPESSPQTAVSRQSIWRNDAFRKFWLGRTISMFGSQISTLALPLLASLTIGATTGQMAGLWGIQFLPHFLIGLFAGAWIDRLPRRPVLIAADLGRAALLLILPIAGIAGMLRMEVLYAVAILVNVLSVFADAADNAYLPAIVPTAQLIDANVKLSTSVSVARVAGSGLAGLLIDLLWASGAIAVDALSFVVSAAALTLIRTREPAPDVPAERRSIWADIGEGLRTFYGNRTLRTFLAMTMTYDLFWNTLFAVYFVYVTRELGLPATAIGIIFAVGSGGALLGALLTDRITRRVGIGPAIIGTQVVLGAAVPLIALPLWLPALALPILVTAEFILGFMYCISYISRASVIQTIVPNRLRARVSASGTFVSLGIVLVGALLGGVLGEYVGVPAAIVIGAFGGFPSFLWVLFSPVRTMRTLPPPSDES